MAQPIPTEIAQQGPRRLGITWSDGHRSAYDVRDLRLACPCATCIDEWTGEARLDPDDVAADVRPVRLESVGRYAIQIQWSDGHDTGLYTFERLRQLG